MTRLCVIGGGPVGVTAALEAAALGADTTLIAAEAVGGRATWASLVPSKVCLTAADHLHDARHVGMLGLVGDPPTPDLHRIKARIAAQADSWSAHHRALLAERLVRVVYGHGRLFDARRVVVTARDGGETLVDFDRAIIATGSVPIFQPRIKPDGGRILAPRLISALHAWPDRLIMIGGGVTGAEYAYFFRSIGAEVVCVTDQPALLPRADADLAAALEESFEGAGIEIRRNAPVAAVTAEGEGVVVTLGDGGRLEGSHAFIAIGRRPDLGDLALDAAGIVHDAAGIRVDTHGRTSVPHIYAAGDAAGPPFVANRGLAQARIAARHALGVATAHFRAQAVIEATYTSPQVAHVGLTERRAAETREQPVRVDKAPYAAALKPRLGESATGFVKIVSDPRDGRVLGGGAVGNHAAEVLASVALAIANGLSIEDLADSFAAHPSLSELPGIAIRGY